MVGVMGGNFYEDSPSLSLWWVYVGEFEGDVKGARRKEKELFVWGICG
jgi:hypothetical protein